MSRAPAKITQAEIVKAIRAADRMGKACEVEIKRDGSTIVRFLPQSTERTAQPVPAASKSVHNEVDWDDVQA